MKKLIVWISVSIVLIIAFLVIYIFYFINHVEEISTGKMITEYTTQNDALLIIDVQEGTTGTEGSGTYQNGSDEYIRALNQIIWSADSMGITVIYIRNETTDPLINFLDGRYAPGSTGSLLDKRLVLVSDFIFSKDRGDAFWNPKLDSLLVDQKISNLTIIGLDAAQCVNRTIQGALNRGYNIEVISPGLLAKSQESLDNSIASFQEMGVNIIYSFP